MYAYLKGILEELTPEYAVLDVNGVGYQVYVPGRTLSALHRGDTMKLHTYLQVREDAMVLFGFQTGEEKAMFLRLLTVSGIGPKMAMAILSGLSVSDLAIALVTDDVALLSRVPGVGKKTAQRLILELKEKVDNSELVSGGMASASATVGVNPAVEAVHALAALGLSQFEAQKIVNSIDKTGMSVEDIIKAALKTMSGGQK